MKHGLKDIARDILGLPLRSNFLRRNEYWANRNITFELKRGECLGVIGRNGAGKSTLLKMLNGIILPDEGMITVKGKVGALIEVGAGFHPLLTGRENIYINAAILGLSKKEIDRRFDEIVDFAQIEFFLDAPVKTYSSGMYVRLGFAVAAYLQPDILLIDEILAVGDIGFQSRCLHRISYLLEHGTAILFVSHQMSLIDKISNLVLLLQSDELPQLGSPSVMIDAYRRLLIREPHRVSRHDHPKLRITRVKIYGKDGLEPCPGEHLVVEAEYACEVELWGYPSFAIHRGSGEQIAACRADRDGHGLVHFCPPGGHFGLNINDNPLAAGEYSISVRIFDKNGIAPLVNHQASYPFIVTGGEDTIGWIHLSYEWHNAQ